MHAWAWAGGASARMQYSLWLPPPGGRRLRRECGWGQRRWKWGRRGENVVLISEHRWHISHLGSGRPGGEDAQ